MSVELSLIRCVCDSREMFDKYYPYIKTLNNMDRDMRLLFTLVAKYYEKYNTQSISKDDLMAFYDYMYPLTKNRTLHTELIHNLFEMKVNVNIVQDHFENVMERHYAARMVQELQPVLEGGKFSVLPTIKDMAEEYVTKMKNPPPESMTLQPKELSIEELVSKEISPEGPTWPLQGLNNSIGVLRRGKFGIAYAYVDTGKSSFGARCSAHWLKQLKENELLIYAGNEEGLSAIQLRIWQSLLDKDKFWIAQNMQAAKDIVARWTSRLKMFDSIYHIATINKLLEQYHPMVLVVDQVTKLKMPGKKQSKDVEELEAISNFCREKAKEFDTSIFGLTQGTGESHDKLYLELTDMYNSRVGIQGELDYAIGIGMDRKHPENANRRYFNVAKNKFGDHVRFMALFDSAPNIWTEV